MFPSLVNWLLVILAGLATGVIMVPVRWGMIATWLGSSVVGYIGFWVYLIFTIDRGK
ncbi:hypothetical protein LCGC14_2846140 [marine sediment metagenome]|uniref:Uncharacterized protein n=1 Tax=marine sediment metagenome TaxID=412755 RepID=A0A0F9AI43_9ZZZZ